MTMDVDALARALGSDSDIDIRSLVRHDRLHASLYVDERIFAREIDRIWRNGWVFVGHESEIPTPGDYRRKYLSLCETVMSRDHDGQVHVLVNACPHRGNLVCTSPAGSSRAFRCSYHGWTFRSDGTNIGVTLSDGYDPRFGCGTSMTSLPRVASYRGFVFASFAPEGPNLDTHLGAAMPYIDRYVDRSPTGSITIAGEQRVRLEANWKLAADNTMDGYHPRFVHHGVFWKQQPDVGRTSSESATGFEQGSRTVDLGNGHQLLDWGPPRARTGAGKVDLPQDLEDEYERALRDGLGPERAERVINLPVPHLLVYPNLFLLQNDLRVFVPISPSEMSYNTYFWLMEGVDPRINRLRLAQHQRLYSAPTGFVISDDLALFERIQEGLSGGGLTWLDQSRGMHREQRDPDTGRPVGPTVDEVGHRGMWRHYAEVMA